MGPVKRNAKDVQWPSSDEGKKDEEEKAEEKEEKAEEPCGFIVPPKHGWLGTHAEPVPPERRPRNKPECEFLVFARECGWRGPEDFKDNVKAYWKPRQDLEPNANRVGKWINANRVGKWTPPRQHPRQILQGLDKDGAVRFHDPALEE